MSTNLNFDLYFNITFAAIIGFGALLGLIRGLRKSIYDLIVTLIFYALFFASVDVIATELWDAPLSFMFQNLGGLIPGIETASTFGDALVIVLNQYLGDMLGLAATNEELLIFLNGLGILLLKIIYAILYFTIFAVIYRFIFFIIRILFFGKTEAEENYRLARKQVKKMKLTNRYLKKLKKQEKREFKKLSRKQRKERLKAIKKISHKRTQRKEFKKLKKETKNEFKQMSRKEKRSLSKLELRRYKFVLKHGYCFTEDQLVKFLEKPSKHRLAGAVVGAAKGAVVAYISLIMFGGLVNIIDNFSQAVTPDTTVTKEVEQIFLSNTIVDDQNFQQLATTSPFALPTQIESQVDMLLDMSTAFNNNVFVQTANVIKYSSADYNEPIPMYLYLFDEVLSFPYKGADIEIRKEIVAFSQTAEVLFNSEYMNSNDLSDIKSEEIIALFDSLSQSELVTQMIPLAIEVASEKMGVDLQLDKEELYQINWQAELETIGSVAAIGFDLINTAGLTNPNADLTQVTLDGTEVKNLFDSLSDSKLATLGAYVAVEPLLEKAGTDLQAIITVPDGIDWSSEFESFGLVAEAVLDTGVTLDELSLGDPMTLLTTVSDVDLTVLLQSEIVSQAMINILSGEAGLSGLDMIVIPDGIQWRDLVSGDELVRGELYNILNAINALTNVASDLDLSNIDISLIAEFDVETIDTLFDSEVLVATISNFVTSELDFGDTAVLVPDNVFDSNGYITKEEMKAIAKSANVLVTSLPCAEGDTVCEEIGFDLDGAFTLSTESIDTLITSDVIAATLGNLIVDSAGEVLTIPLSAQTEITIDSVPTQVISKTEISSLFAAVSVLEFDNLDNITFDVGILNRLALDNDPTELDGAKSAKLFSSKILHATISDMLIDLEEIDDILLVPTFDETQTMLIRQYDETDQIEYINTVELDNVLQALISLNITDFNNIDALSIDEIINHSTEILASSILQATISKQVLDLGSDIVTVPYTDQDGNLVRVTVGLAQNGTETEYIKNSEIEAILDALTVLNVTDIQTFSGDVDVAQITSEPNNITRLLASATIHATVSKQILDLTIPPTVGEDPALIVPYYKADGTTQIRITTGPVDFETEYIEKNEIEAMMDVLDLLNITTNLDQFDGSVDLSTVLGDATNYDILLSSATIHATITKQLLDLETSGSIVVPYTSVDNTTIRYTVGNEAEGTDSIYILGDEVKAMLDVLDLLGIADNLDTFDGNINLGSVLGDSTNYDILLSSATIHATISDQLFDLDTSGSLVVPYFEDDDTTLVRVTVGDPLQNTDVTYVSEVELRKLLDALDVLGLATNLDSFDGQVDIASATQQPGNTAILLNSSIIQATISKQLIDLDTTGDVVLPFFYEDNTTKVRITVGNSLDSTNTEYVTVNELQALIDAMNVLDITGDISTFNANNVDLSILGQGSNANTVLSSALIQATVSKQVIDLVSDPTLTDTFIVPYLEDDGITEVRFTVGDVFTNTDNEYILRSELVNLIKGLDLLGITNVDNFNGNIDLNTFFDPTNRAILLSSSIMQATISTQLIEIDNATLAIPYLDSLGNIVRLTVDPLGPKEQEYITVEEIDAIFGAFKELNITNFDNFTGIIDISVLDSETSQDAVLQSASIHAKISDLLIGLEDAVLIVPMYSQAGESLGNEIRITVGIGTSSTEYVVKSEIKALINAFTAMGFTDLNNFGSEISSTAFFSQRSTLLLSSSIQATISDKMINGTNGELIVPDEDVRSIPFDIRLTHTDGVTYIEINELNAIFDGLEALGLQDFATMSFDPATIFSADFDLVLTSASLQATISANILPSAVDENVVTYSSGTLVVPTSLRQLITVAGISNEQIEKTELKELLQAMNALGFTTDFGSGVGGSTITSMNDATLDEMFDSGTIHTTIHFMLKDNSSLVIPDEAKVNISFLNNITSETEIRKFLTALNTLGQTDFANASFGLSALASISSASDRDIIADAMITRATLHSEVETLATNALLYPTGVTASDYMNSDTNSFFIKTTFLDVVNTVYPPTAP